jgi:hypothetical protein
MFVPPRYSRDDRINAAVVMFALARLAPFWNPAFEQDRPLGNMSIGQFLQWASGQVPSDKLHELRDIDWHLQ